MTTTDIFAGRLGPRRRDQNLIRLFGLLVFVFVLMTITLGPPSSSLWRTSTP